MSSEKYSRSEGEGSIKEENELKTYYVMVKYYCSE
jgi:hypothetical protein